VDGLVTLNTSVEDHYPSMEPRSFNLSQNYPNPFNPATDIRYQIMDVRSPMHTSLTIYNLLGQSVKTLVNETKDPGYYSAGWNGCDESGRAVPSGICYYQLTADDFTATRHMLLLK
jgi:hypothetical protein